MKKILAAIKYLILLAYAVVTLYPLYWIAITSLKTRNEIYGRPFQFPLAPQWRNYQEAWTVADIPSHLLNTAFYALVSVVVVMLISSMSAYVLAKVAPNKRIYRYFSLGIMIPFNSIIIPFILIFRSFNILNTRFGIILAFIVTNIAFSIFILTPFMQANPDELEEAARIDGCNRLRIFFRIVLPISKAGLATVGTFVLIGCWNDLFLSLLIISRPALITLNQVCYNMKAQYTADYGLISAVVMVMAVPVILLYSLFQKQIIKGMTAGSVKG